MNDKNELVELFVIIGILILFQQYVYFGVWFSIDQLHHETFALIFFAMAFILWHYGGKK